jgi:hypothetical protein
MWKIFATCGLLLFCGGIAYLHVVHNSFDWVISSFQPSPYGTNDTEGTTRSLTLQAFLAITKKNTMMRSTGHWAACNRNVRCFAAFSQS